MDHTRAHSPMCDNHWDAWTGDSHSHNGGWIWRVCRLPLQWLSEARKHPGHDLDCSLILFFPFSPSWVVTVFVPCDLTLMVMADYTVVDQKIQSLARMIESVFLRKEDTPKVWW